MTFDRNRLTIKKLEERKSKTSYNPMRKVPALDHADQIVFIDRLAQEIVYKEKVIR